jgi:hypothetical protein
VRSQPENMNPSDKGEGNAAPPVRPEENPATAVSGKSKKPVSRGRRIAGRIIKWGFLGFLAIFLIWRIDLAFRVSHRLDAVKNEGYPVNAKELDAWYPAVSDEENAALLYVKAGGILHIDNETENQFAKIFQQLSRTNRLTSELQQYYLSTLKTNEECLALIRKASALQKSRYPVDFSVGPMVELPHIGKLKNFATLLQKKIILAAEAGDNEEATRAMLDSLALSHSLDSEPCLISYLSQKAIRRISCVSLERAINKTSFTDSQLGLLAKSFNDILNQRSLPRAFAGERASDIPVFRNPLLLSNSEENAKKTNSPVTIFFLRASGILERDLRFFLDSLATNISLAELDPPTNLIANEIENARQEVAHKKWYFMSGILLPSLTRTLSRQAEDLAILRVTQTALAVERWRLANPGKLPPSLSELVPVYMKAIPDDPFDGQPLRFKLLETGYRIYSIGPDQKDNSGLEREIDSRKRKANEEYDLTFSVERR